MTSTTITVKTRGRTDFVDITAKVAAVAAESAVKEGLLRVYVPHTTAGITINENADPAVVRDIEAVLDRLVPWEGGYAHAEGNSAAHVKASLMGSHVAVPILEGRLALGTWQGVYFCDFDGPRTRRAIVTVTAG